MKRTRLARVSAKERRIAPVWRRVKKQVRERSGGRCEVAIGADSVYHSGRSNDFRWSVKLGLWRCIKDAQDPHHVIKRSQSSRKDDSPARTLDVCRECHEWFDAWHGEPRGKLMADPVEDGGAPRCWIRRTDKFEARRAHASQS